MQTRYAVAAAKSADDLDGAAAAVGSARGGVKKRVSITHTLGRGVDLSLKPTPCQSNATRAVLKSHVPRYEFPISFPGREGYRVLRCLVANSSVVGRGGGKRVNE